MLHYQLFIITAQLQGCHEIIFFAAVLLRRGSFITLIREDKQGAVSCPDGLISKKKQPVQTELLPH